jgi:hypothetical protein
MVEVVKLFHPKATPEQRQKAVAGLVQTLNADRRPILIGPFRSELGFEVSYWLPFLTWLASKVMKFDRRAAVVTRGGMAPLYKAVASQGLDLYALRSVADVRRENAWDHQQTQLQKQTRVTDWDTAVLSDAAKALQLTDPHLLHPAWMYWALEPYWAEHRGLNYLLSMTDYRPLEKPAFPDLQTPPQFTAVKFYARATFPYPDPHVISFVQNVVGIVAAQCPVVLLGTGGEHDDHSDIVVSGPNIHRLPEQIQPEQNLLIQAAVLAKATAFIGTYGGVAQLALRMGVPSVSFYKEFGGTCFAHLSLSSYLSKALKVPFVTCSLSDADLLRQVIVPPPLVGEKTVMTA